MSNSDKDNTTVPIDEWKLGKLIGESKFSKVRLLSCASKVNDMFVGKFVKKTDSRACCDIQNEIKFLKMLKHDNIVEIITSFETETHIIAVLKFYEAKSLDKLLEKKKRMQETECKDLFKQILLGLQYLKSHNIVHRDIKPANIFLEANITKVQESFANCDDDCFIYDVKLGDFGFAILSTDESCIKELGTPNYVAPEMIFKEGALVKNINTDDNFKIDIWSTGVTFYTCLIGYPPFETKTKSETFALILNCQYAFPRKPEITTSIKELIGYMIKKDIEQRMTVEQLLEYEFFIE